MPVSRIREVDHSELTPMENNPNKGTQRGHKLLRQSLSKLGAGRSIGVSADGKAFAGNQTLEAAVELGLPITTVETWGDTLIAVKRMDVHSDDPRFMELAIADNKTSQEGIDWDLDSLEIAVESGIELDEWFFEDELLDTGRGRRKKLTGVNVDLDDEINLDDPEAIKVGDAFILGRHRLEVGLAEKRGDAAVMIAAWEQYTGQKALRDVSLEEFGEIPEDI